MPKPPRDLLRDFQAAIETRLRLEREFQTGARASDPQLAEAQAGLQAAEDRAAAEAAAIDAKAEARRRAALERFETAERAARTEHDAQVRQTVRALDAETADLERQHADSAWVVTSLLDESHDENPVRQHERFVGGVERTRAEQTAALEAAELRFEEQLQEAGRARWDIAPDALSGSTPDDLQEQFQQHLQAAEQAAERGRKLFLPRLFKGFRSLWLFALLFGAIFAPVLLAVDPALLSIVSGRFGGEWLAISFGAAAIGALIITLALYSLSSMAVSDVLQDRERALATARAARKQWDAATNRDLARRDPEIRQMQAEMETRREETLERYRQTYDARIAELRQRRADALSQLAETLQTQHREATARRDAELAAADADHQSRQVELAHSGLAESDRLKSEIAARLTARQKQQSAIWSELKTGWERATADLWSAVDDARADSGEQFPNWPTLAAPDRNWPTAIPSGIRLGEFEIHLDCWEGAVSSDMRLAPRTTSFRLPATLPFPARPSLLLKSSSPEGRAAALPILQTAVLRLLTSLPPGTIRLTLIDPVGLGDSFAGLMHLADTDELLVNSRIWTEPGQIEARLADLTEHMENVLQTYLRNEFPTLEDYNAHAGEVAEPYRILVIRDFPSKFSEVAARRLTSIIVSGPRCGVYTLMAIDGKLLLPNNFHLADIEAAMNVFEWRSPGERRERPLDWVEPEHPIAAPGEPPQSRDERPPAFYAVDPVLSDWPLLPDEPPPADTFSRIVKQVGAASRGARRVEVSFERIAPSREERWSRDSRAGIDIPMGRAGAVKLQHVRLGQGTSQHMLIAGKTGSGKSTFLHGLITNLALHYSPDELQFFLIDFKKGVEFKDYAAWRLPHARVIAIESDREFGVSALTRLDELMQERGELFRRHGVQDIAGFRNANPRRPLPRVLLVIDEFQEFFVEDDRYSQSAALLLDRLVRQGRAFGIHVVLGSQTLGGAYSLARSTLGQVAVRVALQCSEADAHLILSEDNTAARLLTRPGEAIYNDANGLVEGNHPFQIAWLPDDQREQYLRELSSLAEQRQLELDAPLVFEGNVPSDLSTNSGILRLIEAAAERSGAELLAPRVWLGDAVEIGDPTSLSLERQTSANALFVGQEQEAVQGIFASAALALALQGPADDSPERRTNEAPSAEEATVWLFDGSAASDPARRTWARLQEALGGRLRIVAASDAAGAVGELMREFESRDGNRQEFGPTIGIFIYNLSRFRDLRKAEDDFGFGGMGGSEAPPSSAKQFSQLLSGGPDLGLHAFVWADSYNNVERWFSRQTLRDFEWRILFPMNAADSSNLIDSPQASRLGPGRGILYREDRGTTEKFRPYAVPADELLAGAQRRLQGAPPLELATDLEEFRVL
ncbi:MAG: hypothetical protein KF774_14805 [Planctomyces sp.]|nr:hypothetical protein [Planctomyces sp.]